MVKQQPSTATTITGGQGPGRPSKMDAQQTQGFAEVAVTGTFSWDEYLEGSDKKSAAKECFKQAVVPPVNEFTVGMKMESRDPRNDMSYCIATVVHTKGPDCPRLCLRLDGSDNRNDFWSLVDSQDIHPYGWCEENGEQLQPPLGFSRNASSWPAFLSKLLQESKDAMAPATCFKPAPPTPEKNMFEVGMKLEAVDRKHPYLIGPATVGDIDGEKILVQFDGWKGAFDYWCSYYSRDIFPVGWCASTGYVLQPPGMKGGLAPKSRRSSTSKSQSVSPKMTINVETAHSSVGTASPGSKSAGSYKHSPAVGHLVSPASVSPGSSDHSGVHVTAFINQTCSCGPLLSEMNIIRLPLQYGPSPIPRALRKIVQALVDSAISPQNILNKIPPGNSQATVTAKVGGKLSSLKLPYINSEQAFEAYISDLLNSLQCCANLITVNSPKICRHCAKAPAQTSAPKRSQSMVEHLNSPPNTKRPKLKSDGGSKRNKPKVGRPPRSSPPLVKLAPQPQRFPTATCPEYPMPQNPNHWTISDVIHFVKTSDVTLAKYAYLLKNHEIDGSAFSLLTSDIAIKYMEMKVGPALKLCHLVDELRKKVSRERNSHGY